jgi:hypothetical protein
VTFETDTGEQKFFGAFFQKSTKEKKHFFLKKEAKTFAPGAGGAFSFFAAPLSAALNC